VGTITERETIDKEISKRMKGGKRKNDGVKKKKKAGRNKEYPKAIVGVFSWVWKWRKNG